jgi:hypothetical protein
VIRRGAQAMALVWALLFNCWGVVTNVMVLLVNFGDLVANVWLSTCVSSSLLLSSLDLSDTQVYAP